jgi:hypothetical protein
LALFAVAFVAALATVGGGAPAAQALTLKGTVSEVVDGDTIKVVSKGFETPVRLIGVCIPWSHAHVNTGRRDRSPWQDHLTYLKHLGQLLAARDDAVPTLLVGDFNQRVPPTRAPLQAATALRETLGDLVVASAGDVPGIDRQVT